VIEHISGGSVAMFTVIAFASAVPGYALLSADAVVVSFVSAGAAVGAAVESCVVFVSPDSSAFLFFVPQPVNIVADIARTKITASNFLIFINISPPFLYIKRKYI
jgi:hypothetical protein